MVTVRVHTEAELRRERMLFAEMGLKTRIISRTTKTWGEWQWAAVYTDEGGTEWYLLVLPLE